MEFPDVLDYIYFKYTPVLITENILNPNTLQTTKFYTYQYQADAYRYRAEYINTLTNFDSGRLTKPAKNIK